MLSKIILYRTQLLLAALLVASIFLVPGIVLSQAQGFENDERLYEGSIVSFDNDDATDLIPANVNNQHSLRGVVIPSGSTVYTIEEGNSNVTITAEGIVETLVSDVNGPIAVGDFIAVSQINGVGMKSDDGTLTKRIVGIAITDFDSSAPNRTTVSLPEIDKTDVSVGRIPVQLLINGSVDTDDNEQSLITKIGERVVGRPVTFFQTTIAILLFFLTLSVSSVLLYGAIIGSFTSLGRNPLAAKVIVSNLIRVAAISITVLLLGVGAAYGVLLL